MLIILQVSKGDTFNQVVLELASVMLFPDCDVTRNSYKALYYLEYYRQSGMENLINPDLLQKADNLGLTLDKIHHVVNCEIVKAASLSGCMLLLTIGTDPNIRSLNYAREILSTSLYGEKTPTSKTSLDKHWRKYHSVAHLWAAYVVMHDPTCFGRMHIRPGFPCDPSQIGLFILLAERFRECGETIKPSRSRANILDPETTWKLCPNFRVYVRTAFELQFNHDLPMFVAAAQKRVGRYHNSD